MSSGRFFTEKELGRVVNQAYAQGSTAAALIIIGSLEATSLDHFQNGQTETAVALRDLAVSLRTEYMTRLEANLAEAKRKVRIEQLEETAIDSSLAV